VKLHSCRINKTEDDSLLTNFIGVFLLDKLFQEDSVLSNREELADEKDVQLMSPEVKLSCCLIKLLSGYLFNVVIQIFLFFTWSYDNFGNLNGK